MGEYRELNYETSFNLRIAENIACRTIKYFGNKKIKFDRDNIDFVTGYVVRGYTRFNPSFGTKLRSFLIYNAKRGIQDLLKIKSKKKKIKFLSLDNSLCDNFAKKHVLPSRDLPLFDRVMAQDIFQYIRNSKIFNERQKIVLIEHFQANREIIEIAEELGVHISYAYKLLYDGIEQLKRKFRDDN